MEKESKAIYQQRVAAAGEVVKNCRSLATAVENLVATAAVGETPEDGLPVAANANDIRSRLAWAVLNQKDEAAGQIVNGLRYLASSVEIFVALANSDVPLPTKAKAEYKPNPQEATATEEAEPQGKATETKAESAALDFAEVRHRLAVVAKAGFSGKIKEILKQHGAEKLSDLDPAAYAGVLAEAENLATKGAA